jgi:hypothetical protein
MVFRGIPAVCCGNQMNQMLCMGRMQFLGTNAGIILYGFGTWSLTLRNYNINFTYARNKFTKSLKRDFLCKKNAVQYNNKNLVNILGRQII